MPEPGNGMEFMDVLSSIRRLVSEDRKGGVRPATGGRLVLTEAHRVSGAEASGSPADEAQSGPALAWRRDPEDNSAADAGKLEDTIAELEAAVAGIGSEFEPDGGEPDDENTAQMPDFAPADENAHDDRAAADRDASANGDEPDEDAIAAAEVAMSHAAVAAEAALYAAAPANDGDEPGLGFLADRGFRPTDDADQSRREYRGIMAGYDLMAAQDDPLDAPVTGETPAMATVRSGVPDFWHSAAAQHPVQDDAAFAAFNRGTRAAQPEPAAETGATTVAAAPPPAHDGPIAAADETVCDAPAGDMVPDDLDEVEDHARFADADDDAGSAAEDDVAEAAEEEAAPLMAVAGAGRLHFGSRSPVRPVIVRPATDEGEEAPPLVDPAPDMTETPDDDAPDDDGPGDLFDPLAAAEVDIDHLRDMVTEIIREELRGRLGERLTRNLRLLVRREIERSLAEAKTGRD